MRQLTGQAAYCRERAAACAIRAKRAHSSQHRRDLVELANHWLALAGKYELAEHISGFLAWDAQRLKPPEAA